MPRSVRVHLRLAIAVVMGLQVAVCGGGNERAEKAAKWLKGYSQTNPPNGEWVMTNVEVDGGGRVVMDVLIPYKEQVDLIKSRNKIEQSHIVYLACPPKDAEIWTVLGKDGVLWVNLTARTENGLAETLIGASCKH